MSNRRLDAVALASLLAFLAVAAPARAQVANPTLEATQTRLGAVTFSVDASIGQIGGTAYERAYDYPFGDRTKLSELKWDLQEIAMAGVRGTAQVGRFRVGLGYWGAVNEGDGEMVDRDWMFLDPREDWTHESRHPDTDLDSGSILDVTLDYRAFTRGPVSVSGILGYRRNKWKWSVRGGEYTYTEDYNDDGYITPDEYRAKRGRFPDDVLVIEYEQEYTMPYLGIGCEGTWGFLNLRGHLLYSPWVSAEDHDYHALRDVHFDGDYSGGDWFGAGASATWFFMPRWYASLGVEYQKFDEIIGDVTVSGNPLELPQGPEDFSDGGGVELETVMLLFGVGYRF